MTKWAWIIHMSLFYQTLSSHAQGWKQGIQKSSWRGENVRWMFFVHKATLTNQNQHEYHETNINKKMSLACVIALKTSKTANQPTSRCMHHRCIHNARGTKLKSVFSPASTLPETNIFAPENGWLEYDRFLLGWHIFMGYASLASIAGWHWWPESLKTIKKPKGKKQPCGLPRSMVQSRSVNEFDIE